MTSTAEEVFAAWCAFLAPTEGGLSLDPRDSGNYTPDGRLVGTKFGISAHSYPDIDIPNLTLETANQLRKRDYWDKVRGDELPGSIAFILAEAAYGSGPGRAIMQMQDVLGVTQDGAFGPNTWLALMARLAKPNGINAFVVEYEAQRLLFEASLGDKWENYKVGWTRRMFGGTVAALSLDKSSVSPVQPATDPAVITPPVVFTGELDSYTTLQLRRQVDQTLRDVMRTALGQFTVTIKPLLDTPSGPQSPEDLPPTADNLNAAELAKVQGA